MHPFEVQIPRVWKGKQHMNFRNYPYINDREWETKGTIIISITITLSFYVYHAIIYYNMLCYAMPCCAVLCYAMLH